MRILAIGDPHGDLDRIKKIPTNNIDLILLTGDLGSANLMRKMYFENIHREKQGLPIKTFSPKQEKQAFMEAYTSTIKIFQYLSKIAPVYTIFGNVESTNSETRMLSRDVGLKLPLLSNKLKSMKNVKVINNRVANICGIRVGGLQFFLDSSWVWLFKPSNYKISVAQAKKETEKAKRVLKWFGPIDILLCHQPPFGILDEATSKHAPKSWQGKHAGSKVVLDYIKKKQPGYVLCGHIHEGKGAKKIGKTQIFNLGSCGYKIINQKP